jgi:hypothetical protein
MSEQRPPAELRHGGGREHGGLRLAVASCLLVLIAAGLRARVPGLRLDGPLRHDALPVGATLEAVLACLAVALAVRHSRAPRDAVVAARLRTVLGYIVGAGLIAIPVLYLLNGQQPKESLRPVTATPQPTPSATAQTHVAEAGRPPAALIIVLCILLALILAGVMYWIIAFLRRHRGFWSGSPGRVPRFPIEAAAETDEPGLRDAVASGYSAMRGLDDARAAIIACYLAMEESLARAGTPRGAADTPDELLARAAGQGLVQGGAAERLTGLFYEARFSSHPMFRADRDGAERALAELAATLGDKVPAGAPDRAAPDGAALDGAAE